jgi:hypothetical protein
MDDDFVFSPSYSESSGAKKKKLGFLSIVNNIYAWTLAEIGLILWAGLMQDNR